MPSPTTNFPASLDDGTSLPNPGSNAFTNAPSHAGQHDIINDATKAIQAKIGIGASTPTSGKVFRGTGTGTSAWAQVALTTDVTGTLPVANGGTGVTTIASFLANVYPVNCIYTETSGTNPATTFGFGTWTAFGAGRVLIGNGTSDQAFAAGASGGESTHVLTTAEIPSHKHWISAAPFDDKNFSSQGSNTQEFGLWSDQGTYGVDDVNSAIGRYSLAAGGGGSHNNLQPYIVVYFWKRTA